MNNRYPKFSGLAGISVGLLAPAALAESGATGMAGMALSLLLILALFVLAAWLAKRYLPQIGKIGPVKIIGSTMLGAREKVVVVEVQDTWLVLGVGGGQVRTLHTLPKPQKPVEPT